MKVGQAVQYITGPVSKKKKGAAEGDNEEVGPSEVHAATVIKVWNDKLVNLDVSDGEGKHYVKTSVQAYSQEMAEANGDDYANYFVEL